MSAQAAFVCLPVSPADLEDLCEIRVQAMQPSLARLGRFDDARARQRFRDQFQPAFTWLISVNDTRAGFYCLIRQDKAFYLQNLYLLPAMSGQGLGSAVLQSILAQADSAGLPVHLEVLIESDAARFYERHGFAKLREDGVDLYYQRAAAVLQP
ncbi:GNAT superfamily N-acetyltransferase [Silvimonas terrae]|uniref:GNAT superfamily N-acetyltransferase n=1 Tax=Silvimonas terrae TaxID=300266 RepID=A0A840RJV2_9NEIS|nr:GNAT family N-acetyltransferase [Silvimonas terrae]MBB5193397.1 GNAT superfamily N-acetyltransferase [Silvimonas terrae]